MNETNTPVIANKGKQLLELEIIIEKGMLGVGKALTEIRDNELYKPEFASFKAYYTARWKFKEAHVYRLIGAAAIAYQASPIGELTKESHARALAKVPEAQREAVFKEALAKAAAEGRTLAARHIDEVAQPEVNTVIVTPPPSSTGGQLCALWLIATQAERDSFKIWMKTVSATVAPTGDTKDETETFLFSCGNCGEEFEDDEDAVPLYECGACGTQFTTNTSANGRHQCPDCNKFGSKVTDCGCPECNEGELERINTEATS
jgi:DNA-directed RNA polymerase subunit RPC12/RpoP